MVSEMAKKLGTNVSKFELASLRDQVQSSEEEAKRASQANVTLQKQLQEVGARTYARSHARTPARPHVRRTPTRTRPHSLTPARPPPRTRVAHPILTRPHAHVLSRRLAPAQATRQNESIEQLRGELKVFQGANDQLEGQVERERRRNGLVTAELDECKERLDLLMKQLLLRHTLPPP
eukprot:280105-Prymnesium_polylepis.1